MNIRPYVLHEAGSIPGVPGPNAGLWSGGQTVYVDMDTMEVVKISLIGGAGDEEHQDVPTNGQEDM